MDSPIQDGAAILRVFAPAHAPSAFGCLVASLLDVWIEAPYCDLRWDEIDWEHDSAITITFRVRPSAVTLAYLEGLLSLAEHAGMRTQALVCADRIEILLCDDSARYPTTADISLWREWQRPSIESMLTT